MLNINISGILLATTELLSASLTNFVNLYDITITCSHGNVVQKLNNQHSHSPSPSPFDNYPFVCHGNGYLMLLSYECPEYSFYCQFHNRLCHVISSSNLIIWLWARDSLSYSLDPRYVYINSSQNARDLWHCLLHPQF